MIELWWIMNSRKQVNDYNDYCQRKDNNQYTMEWDNWKIGFIINDQKI